MEFVEKFYEGQKVFSKYFGCGQIVELHDAYALIDFEDLNKTKNIGFEYIKDYSYVYNLFFKSFSVVKTDNYLNKIENCLTLVQAAIKYLEKISSINCSFGKFKSIHHELVSQCTKHGVRYILMPENGDIHIGKLKLIESVIKDFITRFSTSSFDSPIKTSLFTQEIYTIQTFKEEAKRSGLNSDNNNLNNLMNVYGFKQRTKNIILKNCYSSLIEYYRNQVKNVNIYYYSNPLNIDEYDSVIRQLNKELYLIEVETGTYLTKKCLIQNEIDEKEIKKFNVLIHKIGRKYRFFSYNNVLNEVDENNKIISFCNSSAKQFSQFMKNIPGIKTIKIDNDFLYSYTNTKKCTNSFLHFLLGTENSIYLSDIQEKCKNDYNISYNTDKLIRDIKSSTLYYSEEMDKVYKNKECFIQEVYHNGH